MTDASASLIAAEARAEDIGRGILRVDPEVMQSLGLRSGDTVEVQGDRTAIARLLPNFAADRGKGEARLDGMTRGNAGIGIGRPLTLKPLPCKPAESITLRSEAGRKLAASDIEYLARRVDGVPVRVGDRIGVVLFGGRTEELVVERAEPTGAVMIQPSTMLQIRAPQPEPAAREAAASGPAAPRQAGARQLRGYRRAGAGGEAAAGDGRAAARPARIVRPARHHPAARRAAVRPARHRQDAAGARRRRRDAGQLPLHQRPGDHPQALRRQRGQAARDLRDRAQELPRHHLHRRDRRHRAAPRPGGRRCREARRRHAADADGRPGRPRRPGGDRRHQPAQLARPRAAPAGPLRPRTRARRAEPRRAAQDPGDPYPRHAAGTRRRPRPCRRDDARLHRRRPAIALPRGGDGGAAPA